MKKKYYIIGVFVIGIVLISYFGLRWTKHFIQIDSCLDCGGKWNYDLNKCEKNYNLDSVNISDFYWHLDFDTILNKEYLIRGIMLDSISQSPNELIDILNRRKPKCKIEYLDIIGDTIKIRILDDEYLTEQMGTSGADCFMGETIFTLTENNLIKFVRIEMEYGSHAGPGIYSRNDYKKLVKQ